MKAGLFAPFAAPLSPDPSPGLQPPSPRCAGRGGSSPALIAGVIDRRSPRLRNASAQRYKTAVPSPKK
jgi:hypothetical protein